MTLLELKKKISKEFDIPIEFQRWKLNDAEASDDKKTLMSYDVKDESGILHLFILEKVKQEPKKTELKINLSKDVVSEEQTFSSQEANILNISDSDDGSDTQNEKIGSEEGAVGTSPPNKTENDWTCPLCTLRNPSSRPGCLACSSMKPSMRILKAEEAKKPQEIQKVAEKPAEQKNDLNKRTTNRKSSDLFNILVEEKKENPLLNLAPEILSKNYQIPPQNALIMTAFTSPNITRNKYRGVDNFHPNSPYVWKSVEHNKPSEPEIQVEVKKHAPVVTKMILKTSPEKSPSKTNENHYQQLVNLDTADVVPNLEEFECPICMVFYQPREGVVLRDCLHVFCKECLASTVILSEEAEIKCPYIDTTYSCPSVLQEREIRGLVSKENYEKHLAKSIRQAENKIENTFHCKTPNCRGWCIIDEDNVNQFKCPVCTIVSCLTCGVSFSGQQTLEI